MCMRISLLSENRKRDIIIGKVGRLLKEIGTRARRDIQQLLGNKVYLELWVKVEKDWRKRKSNLQEYGISRYRL